MVKGLGSRLIFFHIENNAHTSTFRFWFNSTTLGKIEEACTACIYRYKHLAVYFDLSCWGSWISLLPAGYCTSPLIPSLEVQLWWNVHWKCVRLWYYMTLWERTPPIREGSTFAVMLHTTFYMEWCPHNEDLFHVHRYATSWYSNIYHILECYLPESIVCGQPYQHSKEFFSFNMQSLKAVGKIKILCIFHTVEKSGQFQIKWAVKPIKKPTSL